MGRPKGAKTRSGRTPLLFKQTEIARAVKGVKHGGLEVARVKVTRTGDIVIETGNSREDNAGSIGLTDIVAGGELDTWMEKRK
jgi:hypothetical protein